MPKYGVTEKGFVMKRLDTIKSDICIKLKEAWGQDPSLNPQSAINVLITDFSDEIAELWEVAQDIYYSRYPSSAEGINLDNAMQLGGVTRLGRTKTKYNLNCTGDDGTVIPFGAMVKSTTQPVKIFTCAKKSTISRENFRAISFTVIAEAGETYSIEINGTMFSVVSDGTDALLLLRKIYNEISYTNIEKTLDEDNLILTLNDTTNSSNTLVLSENIIVTSVSSNITFESSEYGQVSLPGGTITEISTLVSGWKSVTNDIAPILGREEETDIEARQSYIKRIYQRSMNMVESISAEILNNVDDVTALVVYENDTNTTDTYNRPPHSVEIVVEGGNATEIAECIYKKKATGIQTYGNNEVSILDDYGNNHVIRFNRPTQIKTWIKVTITRNDSYIQPNYAQIVKDSIVDNINSSVGEDVYLQMLLADIYKNVSGIKYIDIKAAIGDTQPTNYTLDNITVGPREKVSIATDRIEVVLSGN